MPASVEIGVAVLDTLSFVFLTPLVIGEQKLMDLLVALEKATNWLRSVWMGRDYAPLTPATMCGVTLVLAYVAYSSFTDPDGGQAASGVLTVSLLYLSAVLIPAAIISLYWFVRWVLLRYGRSRGLAVIGAVLFLLARGLTIGAALA